MARSATLAAAHRLARTCIAGFILAAVFAGEANAARRVALVIGNGDYETARKLASPPRDAADMIAALKRLGFEVIDGKFADLTKAEFVNRLLAFEEKLQGADVAVFYYSGHGFQLDGQNYLEPIDVKSVNVDTLKFEVVSVQDVERQMEQSAKTSILILDACRTNPLVNNLIGAHWKGGDTQGLASTQSAAGTLIAYATRPGDVASDGEGSRNSPFTAALLKHIIADGEDITSLLVDVRRDVLAATGNHQIPWEANSLIEKFYFGSPPPLAAIEVPNPVPASRPTNLVPNGASDPDVEKAKRYKLLADKGDSNGQVNLGYFYDKGLGGLPKDDKEAARLYKLSADQGNANGQNNLGPFYEFARGGLPRDEKEAARLYKLSADQGNAYGQNNLGSFYEFGRGGLPKDDKEAARLYKLSADQGNAYGQNKLGIFYENGRGGLPKNDKEAARLFVLSGNQGNFLAEFNLKQLQQKH